MESEKITVDRDLFLDMINQLELAKRDVFADEMNRVVERARRVTEDEDVYLAILNKFRAWQGEWDALKKCPSFDFSKGEYRAPNKFPESSDDFIKRLRCLYVIKRRCA